MLYWSKPNLSRLITTPFVRFLDRSKLSKRKHGASIENYRAQGFVPEAIINYLALLGWNPGNDRELYTLDELVTEFSLERVHKSGAVFDIASLAEAKALVA